MESSVATEETVDLTCKALATATGTPESLHRFVVGVDTQPVKLDQAAVEELGDPFARLVLSKGVFPVTPVELLKALDDALAADDPLTVQRTFVLGEGSQLAPGTDGVGVRAFLLTRGEGTDGPDLILSAAGPGAGFVEVMAWDQIAKGFNFYQTRGGGSPWLLAGNSADALRTGSAHNGPFESHPSGHLLMKELRFPWVHWHSSAQAIRADVLEDGQEELVDHPWFAEASGAQELERGGVMPAIRRWTTARLAAAVAPDGTVAAPRQIMESFLGTPTVNLVSSEIQASQIASGAVAEFDVPHAFFVNTECLNGILGLPAIDPAQVNVTSADYMRVLTEHRVALRKGDGSAVAGPPQDTHFAFVVAEPAFEDIVTVGGAIDMGLVSRRLAACLLMVDFSNPVFSPRRQALLDHVPPTAKIEGGQSTFSEDFANAIRATPEASEAGTAQQEFSQLWDAGEDWPTAFAKPLTDYYASVAAKLGDADGLTQVFRLAESRRNEVRDMRISEHSLLFATPDPPIEDELRMLPDGQIVGG